MAKRTNRLLAVRSACLLGLLIIQLGRTRVGRAALGRAAVVLGLQTPDGKGGERQPVTATTTLSDCNSGKSSQAERADSQITIGQEEQDLTRASVLELMRFVQAAHMGHIFRTHDSLVRAHPSVRSPLRQLPTHV